MNQTVFTLTGKRALAANVYELRFAGDNSAITAPGQFVNIRIDGLYLRRPLSVCDKTADGILLICRASGAGTRMLCDAPVGMEFDMLCGLGNGFDPDAWRAAGTRPVLVGGGVGVPPLYWLAKALIAQGAKPVAAFGFGGAADVFYAQEFEELGCAVIVSTVDGSYGAQGLVTDVIGTSAQDCDYAYCCGPVPMLRAVCALPQIVDGQFSFEERMGCGFGACMGCTCKTKYGYKRICKDGPVLRKEEIVW